MNIKHPSVTLRQLSYFVTAADSGSVLEAARRLGVTQPSVSSALVKLESLLGVQLFVRHHAKGIALTRMGRTLLPEARTLIGQASAIEEQAKTLSGKPIGPIVLGCYPSLAPLFVPALVDQIRSAYPLLTLTVIEGTEDRFLPLLETGEVDMALCYGDCLPDHMFRLVLCRANPHVIVSAHHPLAGRRRISLAEIASQPFILLDTMPGRRYFLSIFRTLNLEPKIAYRSETFEVVRGLVGRGVGFSILVSQPLSLRTYEGLGVVCLPIVEDTPKALICIARVPSSRSTRAVTIVQDLCKSIASTLKIPGNTRTPFGNGARETAN